MRLLYKDRMLVPLLCAKHSKRNKTNKGCSSMRTLNLGCGTDTWGTDKLDIVESQPGVKVFDLNSGNPLPYKEKIFTEIKMYGVLEMLIAPQFILLECYRILEDD